MYNDSQEAILQTILEDNDRPGIATAVFSLSAHNNEQVTFNCIYTDDFQTIGLGIHDLTSTEPMAITLQKNAARIVEGDTGTVSLDDKAIAVMVRDVRESISNAVTRLALTKI
jgi:hypothetical protein